MERKETVAEIVAHVAAEMEKLQYAPLTIAGFIRDSKHLQDYIQEKTGGNFFTEDLGRAYLKERVGFAVPGDRPLTSREAAHMRCVRRIGEYQLYGLLLRNHMAKNHPNSDWALDDPAVISAFIEKMQTADNSEATKRIRINHLRRFYEFLESRHLHSVHEISAQLISDFAMTLHGDSPVYNKHRLGTLQHYFRFLYRFVFLGYDWSHSVPKVIVASNRNVPALWEAADLEKLLKSVDRGSPAGKRNYAIILLVVQLGLRISDVSHLRLDSLKWERSEIELVQHKTQNRLVQPMPKDVGWSIIDYIRYGRPKVNEPFVFLTANAPYTQLVPSSIGCILDRQMRRCGIQKKPGITSGMHSLRHALARRLLEDGTPLSTVADVMGHAEYNSTAPYLKVDIDGLRACALSLEEVASDD